VSLLPAATEIVAALGAESRLVGVSHECDWPPGIAERPRVTSTPVDSSADGAAIDRAVRELLEQGRPVFAVDQARLAVLRPDLVLTQSVCEVCAVSDGAVRPLALALDPAPAVLPLGARNVDGILADIRVIGEHLGLTVEADELVASLRNRLALLTATAPPVRPRVVVIEWLEPPFLAGHWVPELVSAAGGVDVGAAPGAHSVERSWDELAALDPEVVIVACCGFSAERSRAEWLRVAGQHGAAAGLGRARWALDGNAYTSRPGPRVVEGAACIQAALLGREAEGLIRLD
jgi:iron complex transport system substrate-binding protein